MFVLFYCAEFDENNGYEEQNISLTSQSSSRGGTLLHKEMPFEHNAETSDSHSESNHFKDHQDKTNLMFTDASGTGITSAQQIPILDVHKGRPLRLQAKVMVPMQDHPNVSDPQLPFI